MSHNISIGINCNLADMNAKGVQEMLAELGWKILGPGMYKGYGSQKPISVENRVAIPREHMRAKGSDYGELTPDGKHVIVGISQGKAKVVPGQKPDAPTMKVQLDDIGSKDVIKMIEGAVACGKSLDKVDRMTASARAAGEAVQFDRNAYKKQIAAALVGGGKVKVSGSYGQGPATATPPVPPRRVTPTQAPAPQRERIR